jgi:anthranilate 1,2-dioxygenase large subunit
MVSKTDYHHNYGSSPGEILFSKTDGSRVPQRVFDSEEVYQREQDRIFRGETWSFLGLEAEIPEFGDFKATFIGETPVVMTRTADGGLGCWVNRCAHRGAVICRVPRGNAESHSCIYHQWNYDLEGNLQGVPFRRGSRGMTGMPKDFDPKDHSLQQLRVDSYKGLVFATFSKTVESLWDYIGPIMRPYIDRIFCKPIVYLGCTRQFSDSNWKLYIENTKDPYHASLLHLFHTTFNIFRANPNAKCLTSESALHNLNYLYQDKTSPEDYAAQNIRSYDESFVLEDDSILALVQEYEDITSNHIQTIFPQLIIQQIHNSLVARQLLPKGPKNYELIFHFFGYADDTPEMRSLRIKQANLVGPAGYISMEDTEATELIQEGIVGSAGHDSILEMGRTAPEGEMSVISEGQARVFWTKYREIMGFDIQAGHQA